MKLIFCIFLLISLMGDGLQLKHFEMKTVQLTKLIRLSGLGYTTITLCYYSIFIDFHWFYIFSLFKFLRKLNNIWID